MFCARMVATDAGLLAMAGMDAKRPDERVTIKNEFWSDYQLRTAVCLTSDSRRSGRSRIESSRTIRCRSFEECPQSGRDLMNEHLDSPGFISTHLAKRWAVTS